jgi:hypothetical protein
MCVIKLLKQEQEGSWDRLQGQKVANHEVTLLCEAIVYKEDRKKTFNNINSTDQHAQRVV